MSRIGPSASGGHERADENRDLLIARRRADEEAGLQILRRRAAVRRRDADDRADRERRDEVIAAGPAENEKVRQVSSSVATVMPEIGLDDEPISPVSRDETVTNRNPKTMISTAAATRAPMPVPPTYSGLANAMTTTSARTADEHEVHRQVAVGARDSTARLRSSTRRVRESASAARARSIGSERNTLMMPPAATAPGADVEDVGVADCAGLHVLDQSVVVSGASGAVSALRRSS